MKLTYLIALLRRAADAMLPSDAQGQTDAERVQLGAELNVAATTVEQWPVETMMGKLTNDEKLTKLWTAAENMRLVLDDQPLSVTSVMWEWYSTRPHHPVKGERWFAYSAALLNFRQVLQDTFPNRSE